MNNSLKKLLYEYGCPENGELCENTISDCSLSILQLRDRLLAVGDILYEDTLKKIYVVSVRSGAGNLNFVRIAVQLIDEKINMVGYAKEGAIKQHLCAKAFKKIEDSVVGKKVTKATKPKLFFPVIAFIIAIGLFVSIRNHVLYSVDQDAMKDDLSSVIPTGTMNNAVSEDTAAPTEDPVFVAEVEKAVEATRKYNAAVTEYNIHVSAYNEAVILTCIDNLVGLPNAFEELATESESYEDVAEFILDGNSREAIETDTETIINMTKQIEQATILVQQITAPTGEWVMDRLASVNGITGTQMVTETQNPDGLLGKEGGYSDCIYFTLTTINQADIPGSTIVAKGTDAGGAVEVYPTLADAEARVAYLAGFDGTVLYSGSYAIVGTMVIRTSYKLTDEQQMEYTNAITAALTSVLSETE